MVFNSNSLSHADCHLMLSCVVRVNEFMRPHAQNENILTVHDVKFNELTIQLVVYHVHQRHYV